MNPSRLPPGFLERCIGQALGEEPASLVIKHARIFNLGTGTLEPGDIAIHGDRIVGTYDSYTGGRTIDARGLIAVPGFIDSHVHCESSLITPAEFDACVLPRGTTTAICDPHEIANVLGLPGLRYYADSARGMAMDLRVQLSSCVPATELETSGARLDAAALESLRGHPKVLGLAEFMNFPGVFARDPQAMEKLYAFQDLPMDGHAPLVSGRQLNAYLACGIRNCHETTNLAEAREKLEKGMQLLIREGSVAKDVRTLAPALTPITSGLCGFCTDDRNPLDIAEEGHIDFLIRTAIASGVPALHAYRAASLSAAQHFGLRDRGLIAPGRRADILLLEDLESCVVKHVIAGGVPVGDIDFAARPRLAPIGLDSIKLDPVAAADFAAPASGPSTAVIGVTGGKIVTEHLTMTLPYRDGARHADPENGVLKVAVLARYGINRNIGRGFVHGFGFRGGALASSVGHDSHNVCVVGDGDADMALAVNHLISLGGGFVAVAGGAVVGAMALPMAGLISLRPFGAVRDELHALRRAVRAMGCKLQEPFLQLAFLPLPVIPHLKITDMGVVDVDRFALVA